MISIYSTYTMVLYNIFPSDLLQELFMINLN